MRLAAVPDLPSSTGLKIRRGRGSPRGPLVIRGRSAFESVGRAVYPRWSVDNEGVCV
jgi:hypothetical protein